MKVLGSSISMTNRHGLDIVETRQESLRIWKDARTPTAASSPSEPQGDRLIISDEARNAYKADASSAANVSVTVTPELFGLSPEDRILILILEKVLGIKIRPTEWLTKEAMGNRKDGILDAVNQAQTESQRLATALRQAASGAGSDWGMAYDRLEKYSESETLSFFAKGVVNTADGKEISISVQLNLKRQFSMERSLSLRAGSAKTVDPLVINYDGPAADFTNTAFVFDLDFDGLQERLPSLSPGSGFLAMDRNGDGIINDGRELFGPSGGDGFSELAALDSDGNRWLDSSDPAFGKLRIWTRDERGKDTLIALGQKGIGAIYVGSIDAPFSLKDEINNLQGQNTRMGLFLKDGGQPGIIQQVDLAVKESG